MRRPARIVVLLGAAIAAPLATAACGTERISVPKSQSALYHGAVLFNQRCSGCHTLSYAATEGSAANVFTAEFNNGPNFNVRCERPAVRVLYAIENGGFSGAIMPQNIVVGKDAIDVAKFVATYSGRQAPPLPSIVPCQKQKFGSLPSPSTATTASAQGSTSTPGSTSTSSSSSAPSSKSGSSSKSGKKP
jgi:mono/diheme cytochrome c family protein